MKVSLSIDFGTTNTLIASIGDDGKVTVFHLGRSGMQCPSSVYMQADGSLFFGDDAEDMAQTDPANYRRAFKMKLGSPAPLLGSYTAADITAKFLSHLLEQVRLDASMRGATIGSVVLTCPVNFSPAQRESLRRSAVAAGLSKVELVDEPAAAGLAFCRSTGTQAFKHNALVVDWGGGTLDMALVTRGADGRVTVNSAYSYGRNDMGGEVFDDCLCEHVLSKVTLPPVVWPELNRRVRELKHRLSTRESGIFNIVSEGRMVSEPIKRSTFEELIAANLRVVGDAVKNLLNRVPADKKPEMLVLVGGTALIPCIRQVLEKTTNLPTFTWNEAHVAIVKGGAYWGAPAEKKKGESKSGPQKESDSTKQKAAKEADTPKPNPGKTAPAAENVMSRKEAAELLSRRGINADRYSMELQEAINNNSRETLKLLICAGVDISVELFAKWLENDEKELPMCLLRRKFWNVNATDINGFTPLIWAARYNRFEVFETLLSAPGIYADKCNNMGDAALHWAAVNGNLAMVKLLAKLPDVDINKSGADGHTPLKLAIMSRWSTVSDYLLQLPRINVNVQDSKGCSPLHVVAENGVLDTMKKLLAKSDINVNVKDNEGRTPLHLAAMKGNFNCLKALLAVRGIIVNAKDSKSVTPIFEALRSGWMTCVDCLMDVRGIDLNIADDSKITLVHLAVTKNNVNLLKKLLAIPGVKFDEGDNIGNTPLYEAAKSGYVDCVRALLDKSGIDVNKSNDFGWTPLHLACENNHVEVVRALLKARGINVNKNNMWGLGPISYAKGTCSDLLKKAGAMTVKDRWKKFWQ